MILLDTHVWIWWINGDRRRLKPSWIPLIETSDVVGVAAISCFEVAWLSHHDRLRLPYSLTEWFSAALEGAEIRLVELSPEAARLAVELPEHHRDPFDRMIIGTAIANDAQLLSADGRFPAYEELKNRLVLW